MTDQTPPIGDWATADQITEEFPHVFDAAYLRYLLRPEVRERVGFGECVRWISPRKPLISRTRLATWIESKATGPEAA